MRPIHLLPLFLFNYTQLMVAAQSCPGTLRCCRNFYAADNLSSPILNLLDTYGAGTPVGAGVGTLFEFFLHLIPHRLPPSLQPSSLNPIPFTPESLQGLVANITKALIILATRPASRVWTAAFSLPVVQPTRIEHCRYVQAPKSNVLVSSCWPGLM
ncbi:hypothetical protein ASPACDRAFT_1859843 [Aspergillus aculeatus ATCC 16872]|uniref:Hydrophobin n=1 Tax=Aspergillus aculeatus (strain ATCC 16872 / CBS 172.66 / WB 5094) TaxID=690307 RepID=A0A1L9WHD6_ASPA1|nr:uncharacterized protein ASPACDRAFT_1859843 [Aspergillus aculeatus ATCC 16872]OJJ95578.1 hypothetical protein ASPACDRAFT_1859843 [Aspergillus aculeatus ATCC 16872]